MSGSLVALLGLLAFVALSAGAVAWTVRGRRALIDRTPDAGAGRGEGDGTGAIAARSREADNDGAELVEVELVEAELVEGPETTGLVALPRRPVDVRGAGWVAAVAAAAPVAAIGLYPHHRRFLGYHRRKGAAASHAFADWLRVEVRDAGVLGWYHLSGLIPERKAAPIAVAAPSVDAVERRLVLCVHGYTQNATNFRGLRRVLERAGHPTEAVSMLYLVAPIHWYAKRLERRIEALAAARPEGFDIVAHSMGGVVLRLVLRDRPDLRAAIRTVITLGTPHRGTAAARGIPLLPEVRALRRSSPLLRELPQLPALLPHARIITVAADLDTVVYPIDTALVPGTEQVVLRGIGHGGLLTTPRAWVTVRRALAQSPVPAPELAVAPPLGPVASIRDRAVRAAAALIERR